MPFRVIVNCTEFGLNMTAGQLDPPLSPAQRQAMAMSGLGQWVDPFGRPAMAPVDTRPGPVVPITSVMLANAAAYGLNGNPGAVYECNGLRYYWDTVGQTLKTLGGLSAAQVAGLNAGNLVDAQGGVLALSEPVEEVLVPPSATTQILTGPGEYFHYNCIVAAGDITIFDSTESSGKLLVPTTALVAGKHLYFGPGVARSVPVVNGIRVVLSGPAEVYVGRLVS